MHLDFMVVFSNLLGLFLLIGTGFLAVRLRMLPAGASPCFSALLLKITLPCTIFISLATKEYDPAFIRDSLLTLGIGLVAFPAMQLLGSAGARLLRIPEGKRGIWAFCCAYPNTGFMGFPVCLALFGAEGLALAVIYLRLRRGSEGPGRKTFSQTGPLYQDQFLCASEPDLLFRADPRSGPGSHPADPPFQHNDAPVHADHRHGHRTEPRSGAVQ